MHLKNYSSDRNAVSSDSFTGGSISFKFDITFKIRYAELKNISIIYP